MKLQRNFIKCCICLVEKPLTWEHIFPQSIGGTLKSDIQCKECNSNLGSDLVSKLKKSAEIRIAIENLKNELPELHQSIEEGQLYFATNNIESINVIRKCNQFETKFIKKKDSSLIYDTKKGEKSIRKMLAKDGLSKKEVDERIKLFKATTDNELINLSKNLKAIRRTTKTPKQSFNKAPKIDPRVIVLIAYNYLSLIFGEAIFDEKLNFIRFFIQNKQHSSRIKIKPYTIASRKYAPIHRIYPEFDENETRVKIFLFNYIVYIVHFKGVICNLTNIFYIVEDLQKEKVYWTSSIEDANKGIFYLLQINEAV